MVAAADIATRLVVVWPVFFERPFRPEPSTFGRKEYFLNILLFYCEIDINIDIYYILIYILLFYV